MNNIRIVCIYTKKIKGSKESAEKCRKSANTFNYEVELFPSVDWQSMDEVHKKYNLKKKYIPVHNISINKNGKCPITRMANGTTHYLLYRWSVENNEPICITEHDSIFVGEIPLTKVGGVIQISSHTIKQVGKKEILTCHRANKMKRHQPNYKATWEDKLGVIKHPLTGTNGTSGYIIHPIAAQKMIEYIEKDGIAQADRIRTERIGEENLYLQVPQSVLCMRNIKSSKISK